MIRAWTNPIICPARKKKIGRKWTISNGRIEYTVEIKKTTLRVSKSRIYEMDVRILNHRSPEEHEIKTSTQYIWTKLYHWRKPPAKQIPKEEDDDS